MKILVTGGAGFIGSHLVDLLLSKNHNVIVIDNMLLGKKSNLEHNLDKENFSFYEEDLLNYQNIEEIFAKEQFEVIFHMAANSDISNSHHNPNIDFDNTLLTTYNTLKLAKNHNIKQFIFASSSAIYGSVQGKIVESHGPLKPESHYGACKLASEALISSFCENYQMKSWIIRFPNVIGSRSTHGVIYDFVKKLNNNNSKLEVLGDGKQNKPYLYVSDLVSAINLIWEVTDNKINIFNVGNSDRITVKEIAEIVVEQRKVNANITYTGGNKGWVGDVPQFDYSLDKVYKIGWKPTLSSKEAVIKAAYHIIQEVDN